MFSQYLKPGVQPKLFIPQQTSPTLLAEDGLKATLMRRLLQLCWQLLLEQNSQASQVFPLHMLVNFTISRTKFPVALASSCHGDKWQLGISLPLKPSRFVKAWGLFVAVHNAASLPPFPAQTAFLSLLYVYALLYSTQPGWRLRSGKTEHWLHWTICLG